MGAVSTSPYTSVSISGYDSNPPTDDGATTVANQVSWAKHKAKHSDPIKALSESINTNLVTAFAKSINTDADVRNQIAGALALDGATATIGTDVLTPTYSAVLLGSEAGATSDTLQRISATGVYQGALLYIRQRNASEEIVLVHATSTAATATDPNIYLPGNANLTLNDANQSVLLGYDSNTASGWVVHNTRFGLGSMATQSAAAVAITGGTITGITDLAVADGGTGASTFTNGGVLLGNGTSAIQVSSAGTSVQVFTSNGAGVDGTFQTKVVVAASQAEMEAATDNTVAVTPLAAKWSPGVAKAWANISAAGTLVTGHNVSITDNGTGDYTANFSTAFSSANYVAVALSTLDGANDTSNAPAVAAGSVDTAPTTGAFRYITKRGSAATLVDLVSRIAFFGDQ